MAILVNHGTEAVEMPNFPWHEVACKCGCGSRIVAPGFLQAVQGLRNFLGFALPVNSFVRCSSHNSSVGGNPRSLHHDINPHWCYKGTSQPVQCCAADFGFPEGHPQRELLVEAMRKLGWSIGFNKRFIHGDLRTEYVGLPRLEFDY